METLIIRVKTGEDVLCRATKNDAGYLIQDAMALVPTPDGRLAFVGWMPYVDSKNGIQLPHDFVMLTLKPEASIETQYMGFKTGLVSPPQKNVVGPGGLHLVGAP
jgi:hypothetical protein